MHPRHLWFRCAIAVGVLLSVLLLVETVNTFRYVERDLVHEEAQRESDRRLRSIVRAARLAEIEQGADLEPILAEMAHENPAQIAWIRVIARDGRVIARSDQQSEGPTYTRDELRAVLEQRRPHEWRASSGPVVLVVSPLVLGSRESRVHSPPIGPAPEPAVIEVAMYPNRISVNFGPLRQDLIVGISASFALLGAIVVIAVGFRNYFRAKQIEQELALARQVQFDLFPAQASLASQTEFAARCVPARQVGGDLYDVFDTGDDQTAFVLGDVSGKGLPAALLMGLVQGALRASCARRGALKCPDMAEELNRLLCAKTARERFVSLFWGTFDSRSRILRYVNAGHCPALVVTRPGQIVRLETGGPVLGVLEGAHYQVGEVQIQAGDLLVIFSDGIVEAADAHEREFGEELLIAAIEENWRNPPTEICNAILARVNAFLGNQAPQDDQTLVVARLEATPMRRVVATEVAETTQVLAA